MKLSDYVFQFVADAGVKHVFLVTGGGAMHLNASLAQEKRLTPICNSHEQATAMCAESYAKATNGLGVALVTTGPGGTNAITGVAGAWLDSTPTLFLSGQVKRPDRMFDAANKPLGMRQLGVQEVDIVSIVTPITKYATTLLDPLDIRFELEKCLYLAIHGRPGPVWLDIPLDVQAAPIPEPSTLRSFNPAVDAAELYRSIQPNENLKAEVSRVVEQLLRSSRPLLFVGNGTRLARAEDLFTELRLLLDIPTVATWCAADLVPSDVATFVGRPGNVAARGANFALQNCDFLLVLGSRLDMALTGYAPQNLAREAHKVAVDIDPAELHKLHPHLQQPIVADCRAFLAELRAQLCDPQSDKADELPHHNWSAWNRRCADWKIRYGVVTDEHRRPEGLVSIYNLAEVIGTESKPTDKIVSGSSGSGIEIFLLACPTRTGQRLFHTAGLGAMGYGLPMSIAVSIGSGNKQTILVDGDGGFQFNIQELETVRRLNLPVKLFVLNNDGYASIRASQKAYFGAAQIGADAATGLTVPDLSKIAASYNIPSIVIHDQTKLREQVRAALAIEGPVIIDVHVIPDEVRAPRLQSYQRPDGSFVSKPLEDLFPFLPREEFLANMIVKPLEE